MAKNTRNQAATTTTPSPEATTLAPQAVAIPPEAIPAVKLGIELDRKADNAAKLAARMLDSSPEAIRGMVDWLDTAAFAHVANRRQLDAHAMCDVIRQALSDYAAMLAHATELDNAMHRQAWHKAHVQSLLIALAAKAPRSVSKSPEASAALKGYMGMCQALRRVPVELARHMAPEAWDKVTEAEQKREARRIESLQALNALLG